MFEHYKSRMAHKGPDMSKMLRMQSNMVIEQTWNNDPNARQVYVVKTTSGLPEITDKHELVDVKFNVDAYQKVGSDEPAYHLQFRHGAEKHNPDIGVGSYVYMSDEDGEWKWWLITAIDERPQFRQYIILECNWTLKWVVDNQIYTCLAVQRYQNSYSSGLQSGSRITGVDDITSIWVPTNANTQTIGYNQRFLISDVGRVPALCYEVSKISDTSPIGLTKFSLAQTTFNAQTDNVDLMIADYWKTNIEPVEPVKPIEPAEPESKGTAEITYSGTKPTVKVGGSEKTFIPVFSLEGVTPMKWDVTVDGKDIKKDENYDLEYDKGNLKLKVALNYYLIGQIIDIHVTGTDGSEASLSVEVI
jgi:hypothetical protein